MYSGTTVFADMNRKLRECGDTPECLGDDYDDFVELSDAIRSAPIFDNPMNVFRGLGFDSDAVAERFVQQFQDALESGQLARLPGIQSMSMSPQKAIEYKNYLKKGKKVGVALRITAMSGAPIMFEGNPDELEIAHGHGQTYKVTAIDDSGAYTVIDLEQVMKKPTKKPAKKPGAAKSLGPDVKKPKVKRRYTKILPEDRIKRFIGSPDGITFVPPDSY